MPPKNKYSDDDMIEFAKVLAKEYLQHNTPSPETRKLISENKDSLIKFSKKFSEYMGKNDSRWQKHEDMMQKIFDQVQVTNGRVTKLEGKEFNRQLAEAEKKGERHGATWAVKILASIGALGGAGGAWAAITNFL